MIKALAPSMPRGCSWFWIAVVVGGLIAPVPFPLTRASAQDTGKAKADAPKTKSAIPPVPPSTKAETKKAEPEPAEPEGDPETSEPTVQIFKDPRAEKAIEIFESVPGLRDCRPSDVNAVMAMAAKETAPDRDTIQRFVDGMAYRLLDKSNINGVIAPPPNVNMNAASLKGIKESTGNLVNALNTAKKVNNTPFLQIYNQALLTTLPKLLNKNLVTRIEAMIVLGQTGDPNAVPVYLNQIKDPNQTIWVKLWATRGLTFVTDNGARTDAILSVQRASEAGRVLVEFLAKEEELPWPVQLRAVEALGALRQSAVPVNLRKVEMANAAMALLANPDNRPEVRSAAAWALGMMRVNSAVDKYNFSLVAHHIGSLAAELATSVMNAVKEEVVNDKPTLVNDETTSSYYAGLLAGPIFQSLNGIDRVRESGLLKNSPSHSNFTANAAPIRQISDLVTAVVKSAVELVRVAPGLLASKKKELGDRITALKSELDKNPPKDFHLIPDGPEYRSGGGQAGQTASVTGSAVGR